MIDLHIHTNYSGGENNLIEILKIAEKRKVSMIAITDNNTCIAYKELKQLPVKEYFSGKIIPGCEFSTIVNNVPIELIGYNINTDLAQNKISELYLTKEDYNIYETNLIIEKCMEKGYNFVCNDRAVIGIENGIPYIYCGTLQTHIRLGVIHEYFPSLVSKIDKEKMNRPWENKIYINPEFEELGIKVNKTAKLSNILFTSTYPVKDEDTSLTGQREDVATLATMKVLSEYIRADRNIVLSTNYPFPNFDNQELAMKRMMFVEKLVRESGIYTARGNIKKLSDIIDEKLY